jgi:thaumarchaeosortase
MNKIAKMVSKRSIAFIATLTLPTVYVIISNFWGINDAIVNFSKQNGMGPWWAEHMPLSIEYLVFATFFLIANVIAYGKKSFTYFSISTSFLFIIGTIYALDNFYPYGQLTPLQFLVFPTTILAADMLNFLGYQTTIRFTTSSYYGWMPTLTAWDPKDPSKLAYFGIGWPCAGVESLIIYSVAILLFLKNSTFSFMQKCLYFLFGATVTYLINVLRVVTIFIIGINHGVSSQEVWKFHNFYGQLYSITWIIAYPLIIIGSQVLWKKVNEWKAEPKTICKNSQILFP